MTTALHSHSRRSGVLRARTEARSRRAVSFRWDIIARLCVDSGIDPEIFKDGPEDNVSQMIVAWYREHLARGGARDAVQDDLIAEAADEDDFGAGLSYEPGRA